MKSKAAFKLTVDLLMMFGLLFLMGYQFWGEVFHERVGTGMFFLFIIHHILNRHWHNNLFKGGYSSIRILMLCVDVLVLISMLAQMYSGMVMSRYVFDFLPFNGGMALARRIHILGAYWGFLFINLHLGLHWNIILGMFRTVIGIKSSSKVCDAMIFLTGLIIAGCGVWVFISRDFPTYLLLKTEFVFLDYNESKVLFYIDYLALIGLCIFISHYSSKMIRKFQKKREVN